MSSKSSRSKRTGAETATSLPSSRRRKTASPVSEVDVQVTEEEGVSLTRYLSAPTFKFFHPIEIEWIPSHSQYQAVEHWAFSQADPEVCVSASNINGEDTALMKKKTKTVCYFEMMHDFILF